MIDLTSLVVIAGLFLAGVVGDAVLFGDRVQVEISVPSKVSDTGFTEAAAEQVFATEVAEMGRVVSIVETPSVQMSARPTIFAALAKPLSLDNVVIAIQDQSGVDVVTVRGIILTSATGNALDMVTVVNIPGEVPRQIRLTQENGDATVLVQRAAESAMEWVSPYRLALTQFNRGLNGDAAAMAQAKEIATRAIAHPWVPARASEQVMLHNLLAMLALIEGDGATAQAEFRLADAVPDASPSAYGLIELNRSFLDIAAGRSTEAEQHYKDGTAMTASVHVPGWRARSLTLGALVAWSRADVTAAEAMLREAIAQRPDDEPPHIYLARLLEAQGDRAGAVAERTTAAKVRRFDAEIPAQAQSLFWVDPVHGGIQRRD
jgi:hypothetical protein